MLDLILYNEFMILDIVTTMTYIEGYKFIFILYFLYETNRFVFCKDFCIPLKFVLNFISVY